MDDSYMLAIILYNIRGKQYREKRKLSREEMKIFLQEAIANYYETKKWEEISRLPAGN